jgi:hypothetical protein
VASHNRMRARPRMRREASGSVSRRTIKNSSHSRGVFATRVTDITHIILYLHRRRRSRRQEIPRDKEFNPRERCLFATYVALWQQSNFSQRLCGHPGSSRVGLRRRGAAVACKIRRRHSDHLEMRVIGPPALVPRWSVRAAHDSDAGAVLRLMSKI